MRLDELKKKVIKDVAVVAAAAVASILVYVAVSSWQSVVVQYRTEVENQSNQLNAEIATLRSKVDNAEGSQKTFVEYVEKRGNEDFVIDNDQVRTVLSALVARYRLNLQGTLEYSAEKHVELPELATLASGVVVRKDTKLKCAAISDIHVFSFLRALSRDLPGFVRFTDVKVSRKGELDSKAIGRLALGKPEYLVEAEITFDWYGMTSKPKEDTAAQGVMP